MYRIVLLLLLFCSCNIERVAESAPKGIGADVEECIDSAISKHLGHPNERTDTVWQEVVVHRVTPLLRVRKASEYMFANKDDTSIYCVSIDRLYGDSVRVAKYIEDELDLMYWIVKCPKYWQTSIKTNDMFIVITDVKELYPEDYSSQLYNIRQGVMACLGIKEE